MATNGYTDLEAGPEAGWLGYYSLDKASIIIIIIIIIIITIIIISLLLLFKAGRLDTGATLSGLITEAGDTGLVWTDPQVSQTK